MKSKGCKKQTTLLLRYGFSRAYPYQAYQASITFTSKLNTHIDTERTLMTTNSIPYPPCRSTHLPPPQMVRIIHTHTVHHCPREGQGPCYKPKCAKYCHGHPEVCVKHTDTAYLKDDKCPKCVQEAKLIAQREMKAREKGKDPVGDMKKKKAEEAAKTKKGGKA